VRTEMRHFVYTNAILCHFSAISPQWCADCAVGEQVMPFRMSIH